MAVTRTSDGRVYLTNPLTSIFTPPTDCSSVFKKYSSWYKPSADGLLNILQNGNTPGLGPTSSCYPPHFYSHCKVGRTPKIDAIYSPGVCPSGYGNSAQSIRGGVTTAICCPSGFTAPPHIPGKCEQLSRGSIIIEAGASNSMTLTTPFIAYDWAVSVAWASSDLTSFFPPSAPLQSSLLASNFTMTAKFAAPSTRSRPKISTPKTTREATTSSTRSRSAVATPRASKTSTTTMKTTPAPTSTSMSMPTPTLPLTAASARQTITVAMPSDHGLSTATKAGIGAGAGAGFLLIVLLTVVTALCMKKHRKAVRGSASNPSNTSSSAFCSSGVHFPGYPRYGSPADGYQYYGPRAEMSEANRTIVAFAKPELAAYPSKVGHRSLRVELPTSRTPI